MQAIVQLDTLSINQLSFSQRPGYLTSENGSLRVLTEAYKFLKLPLVLAKCPEMGQEIQTLAAFCYLTEVFKTGSSFSNLTRLAATAGLSLKTVKRHLKKLEADGFIVNEGREHRRTATRAITDVVRECWREALYGPLLTDTLSMPWNWSTRLVYAYLLFKTGYFIAAEFESVKCSLSDLQRELGIDRKTVYQSLDTLEQAGFITRNSQDRSTGAEIRCERVFISVGI